VRGVGVNAETDPAFEDLLEFLREMRGFDYTEYKRPSLMRRFRKRMDEVAVSDYGDYRSYLEAEPREVTKLFDTILINVTGFFRDAPTWEFVASTVIPKVLEEAGEERTIRIWSAGCASGEEPFTVAMLFAEALGDDAFRERVKIYATDVDDDAVNTARHAAYGAKALESVPEHLREKYFRQQNAHFIFLNDLRRAVIFGRNDLLQDPPISRVDLLVSRNTLMYFGPTAQTRILSNFSFALQPRGYLLLGKAEAMTGRSNLFVAYDLKRRVFVKNAAAEAEWPRVRVPLDEQQQRPLWEAAFEQAPTAEIVVDSGHRVAVVNHSARTMFGLRGSDVGRPLRDLEVSYRPIELRSLLDEAYADGRIVAKKEISWEIDGRTRYLDVQVTPLHGPAGQLLGAAISFAEVSRHRLLQDELESARRELDTAYEELQSTVEEMETTNEELQSTNEELETTNEELQSTNEELETMNDELRDRTDDALRSSAYLGAILSSIPETVVVVDRNLLVTAWSTAAGELWGLREDEVIGRHVLDLDLGVQFYPLRDSIKQAFGGEESEPLTLTGHDRRGRPIECTVSFAPLTGHDDEVHGAVLVMQARHS
jgi:two-component system CheB/CheR fusion protein